MAATPRGTAKTIAEARYIRPATAGFQPIATINTTPLIDMMLVLIIMFIVAIPLQTHKVPLDLPSGTTPGPERPIHRLAITADGRLLWNGTALDAAALRARLAAHAADPAGPELHLQPDGEARYEQVDHVLADIRRAGVTRLGFVDNQRFVPAID